MSEVMFAVGTTVSLGGRECSTEKCLGSEEVEVRLRLPTLHLCLLFAISSYLADTPELRGAEVRFGFGFGFAEIGRLPPTPSPGIALAYTIKFTFVDPSLI